MLLLIKYYIHVYCIFAATWAPHSYTFIIYNTCICTNEGMALSDILPLYNLYIILHEDYSAVLYYLC